jgi:hypothetical protein
MPKKSPYVLGLSAEQRRELEAWACRYPPPYRDVVCARIVLMAAEGRDYELRPQRPHQAPGMPRGQTRTVTSPVDESCGAGCRAPVVWERRLA